LNPALENLHDALGGACTREALVDAAYILRAPRNLTAIVVAAQEFLHRVEQYLELGRAPEIADYSERLLTLAKIAELDTRDPNLSGAVIEGRRGGNAQPCRPYTGDSAICEMLLMESGGGTLQSAQYLQFGCWFIWQAQRLHFNNTSQEEYIAYLEEEGVRLTESRVGGRLYAAMLAARRLGDPASARHLERIATHFPLNLDQNASRTLTALAHLTNTEEAQKQERIRAYALRALRCTPESLDELVTLTEACWPGEIRRLLRTLITRTV
jgi:hypothetical protein